MGYHEGPVERVQARYECDVCDVVETLVFDKYVVGEPKWAHEWRAVGKTTRDLARVYSVAYCSAECMEKDQEKTRRSLYSEEITVS